MSYCKLMYVHMLAFYMPKVEEEWIKVILPPFTSSVFVKFPEKLNKQKHSVGSGSEMLRGRLHDIWVTLWPTPLLPFLLCETLALSAARRC